MSAEFQREAKLETTVHLYYKCHKTDPHKTEMEQNVLDICEIIILEGKKQLL